MTSEELGIIAATAKKVNKNHKNKYVTTYLMENIFWHDFKWNIVFFPQVWRLGDEIEWRKICLKVAKLEGKSEIELKKIQTSIRKYGLHT